MKIRNKHRPEPSKQGRRRRGPNLRIVNRAPNPMAAMGYRNDPLVERYAERYKVTLGYAAKLFEAAKQFLVLCAVLDKSISPPRRVDQMWHFLILHTREYERFCYKYFGRFVHHNPTDEPSPNARQSRRIMLDELRDRFPGQIDRRIWGLAGFYSDCSMEDDCVVVRNDANCDKQQCIHCDDIKNTVASKCKNFNCVSG